MDPLTVFNSVMAIINTAVALFQAWREWHAHRQPAEHPLEAALRDVASAIRERQV